MKNKTNGVNFKFEKKKKVNLCMFFNPFSYNKVELTIPQLLKQFLLLNLILIVLFVILKFSTIKDSINEINAQFFQQMNKSITIKIKMLSEDTLLIRIFKRLLVAENLEKNNVLILNPKVLYVMSLMVLLIIIITNALISLIVYESFYFIWNIIMISLFIFLYKKLTKEKIDFSLKIALKTSLIAFPWLLLHLISLPFNLFLAIAFGIIYVISTLLGYLKIISRIFD